MSSLSFSTQNQGPPACDPPPDRSVVRGAATGLWRVLPGREPPLPGVSRVVPTTRIRKLYSGVYCQAQMVVRGPLRRPQRSEEAMVESRGARPLLCALLALLALHESQVSLPHSLTHTPPALRSLSHTLSLSHIQAFTGAPARGCLGVTARSLGACARIQVPNPDLEIFFFFFFFITLEPRVE